MPKVQSPAAHKLGQFSQIIACAENTALTVHRDLLNRRRPDMEAASRRHIANSNIFHRVISVYNRCAWPKKLRVFLLQHRALHRYGRAWLAAKARHLRDIYQYAIFPLFVSGKILVEGAACKKFGLSFRAVVINRWSYSHCSL